MRNEKEQRIFMWLLCNAKGSLYLKLNTNSKTTYKKRIVSLWVVFVFGRRKQMIKTQPSRRDFFIVANSIFELKLKPRDFTVYCCLLRHADIANHTCFPSRRTISKECQIDKKTVDVALNSLSDIGLIRKITRTRFDGSKTSNLYHVVDLTKINSE